MARKESAVVTKSAGRVASRPTPAKPAQTAKPAGKTSVSKAGAKSAAGVNGRAKAAPVKRTIAAAPVKPTTVSLKQLAAALSESRGITRRDAESFAAELIGGLVDHVKNGAKVRIAGLGVIELKDRPARTARNPATGEPVFVEASRKVVFRIAKDLRESIQDV